MELELKHLSCYLPYKLKYLYTTEGNIEELNGLYDNGDAFNFDGGEFDMERLKPILRPLSDLTKKIEVNREILIFSNIFLSNTDLIVINRCLQLNHKIYEHLTYATTERMFEYHFDVFGLIENGLAIDKNSL